MAPPGGSETMPTTIETAYSPPSREVSTVIVLTACVQGIVIHALLQDSQKIDLTYVRMLALSLPIVMALTMTRLEDKRFWQHMGIIALLEWTMVAWVKYNNEIPHATSVTFDLRWVPQLAMGLALALFVAMPWLQMRQQYGHFRARYTDLFHWAWFNGACVLLAGLFTGLCWAILGVWAGLFALIGITAFAKLFSAHVFISLSTCVLFAVGILIGRTQHKPLHVLLKIKFALFKGVLPVMAFIALLFIVSLPATGLQPLWQTRHAAQILLGFVALVVLFTNAVWQDGQQSPAPYPCALRRVIDAALLCLPCYCALALYALHLRIAQYGWTPERFFGVLAALLLTGYALGYALAVLRTWRSSTNGRWLPALEPVNQRLSWVFIVTVVLVNSPVLDAHRISAASQLARLHASAPEWDEEILHYLRFDSGRPGYRALLALRETPASPMQTIDDMLARTSRFASNTPTQPALPIATPLLQTYITLAHHSPSPDEDWWQSMGAGRLQPLACLQKGRQCVVRQHDLDGDGQMEILLCKPTSPYHAYCWIHGKEGHPPAWSTLARTAVRHGSHADIQSALHTAPLRTSLPRWPHVMLGDSAAERIVEITGEYP